MEGSTSRRREVSADEAEKWAKKEGMLFLEASAKSGRNVESAFEQASRDILHKIKGGVFDDDRVSVITSQQSPDAIHPDILFQSPGVKLSKSNGGVALDHVSNKQGCCS